MCNDIKITNRLKQLRLYMNKINHRDMSALLFIVTAELI